MAEYTPSEDRVRLDYQDCYPRLPAETTRAEFDRFLARVRRDAWEEGRRAGFASAIDRIAPLIGPHHNPYAPERRESPCPPHPIDTDPTPRALRAIQGGAWGPNDMDLLNRAVPALCDALEAAEHRATQAEARLQAAQDLIDQADTEGNWSITATRLQWAIDGDT